MVSIEYKEADNNLNFTFNGHLDTNTSTWINESIIKELNNRKGSDNPEEKADFKVTFDLLDVSYISSYFIRICILTAKQVKPGNFRIINCDPMIKKTFKIAGLDESLNVS
ncbi:MAG: STAS domain-containing protein [Prolixibacteraceae bacterium]|nr:STAS domain-containing protein [Prolixibacteraceae bacterium]